MLSSYGIDDAADVTATAVPGFGQFLTEQMLAWRRSFESRFKFDPKRGIDPADVQRVDQEIAKRRMEIELMLSRGQMELTDRYGVESLWFGDKYKINCSEPGWKWLKRRRMRELRRPDRGTLDGMEFKEGFQFWPFEDKSVQERGRLFGGSSTVPSRTRCEGSGLQSDIDSRNRNLQTDIRGATCKPQAMGHSCRDCGLSSASFSKTSA